MVKIRSLKNEDIDRCVKLLRLGHDKSFTRQRFEWLHFRSPLSPSIMAVAEDQGQIVGLYSAIKKHVLINEKMYVGARDVDPVVHPDYRKKGIFFRLIDYCLNNDGEVDFHFNFANDISSRGYIKAGWKEIGHIPECVCQVNYDRVLSKGFLLYFIGRLKYLRSGSDWKWVERLSEKDLTGLAADNRLPVSVMRSTQYLKWRYLDSPVRDYSYVVESKGNRYSKILIGRLDPKRNAFIAYDFLYRSPGNDTSIQFVFDAVRQKKYHSLRTWCTCCLNIRSKALRNPFNKHGGLRFMIKTKPESKVPDAIFQMENWMLTPGDLEFL